MVRWIPSVLILSNVNLQSDKNIQVNVDESIAAVPVAYIMVRHCVEDSVHVKQLAPGRTHNRYFHVRTSSFCYLAEMTWVLWHQVTSSSACRSLDVTWQGNSAAGALRHQSDWFHSFLQRNETNLKPIETSLKSSYFHKISHRYWVPEGFWGIGQGK
jgi:hypothetical protein